MQRIIKGDQVVDETWHLLPKEQTLDDLSNCDDVIVPLSLWLDHAHALKARDGGLGVWLDSDEPVEEIAEDLQHFQVIALNFPSFTDGRHYSSARLLRERYGYKGEIRAIGDVLRVSCSTCALSMYTRTLSTRCTARSAVLPARYRCTHVL